jgi:hypothetical protein
MKRLICTLLVVLGGSTAAHAFDKWERYAPPAIDCDSGLIISLGLGGSGSCIQISGSAEALAYGDFFAEWDTRADVNGRMAVIASSDLAVAGVLGVHFSRQKEYTGGFPDPITYDYVTRLAPSEAFVTIGRENSLRAGLLNDTFDSLAPKADDFDWLTFIPLSTTRYGLNDYNAPPLGGVSVQATANLGNGLSAALGVENLEGHDPGTQHPFDTSAMAGTVIAVGRYVSGATKTKVTGVVAGVRDGEIDNWIVSGYAQTKLGNIDLLAVGSDDATGLWSGSLSGKLSLNQVFLAVGAGATSTSREVSASLAYGDEDVGPSIALAGDKTWSDDNGTYSYSELYLVGSILVFDNLKARVGVAHTDQEGPYFLRGSYERAFAAAVWHPTAGSQFSAFYQISATGDSAVSVSAQHRLD